MSSILNRRACELAVVLIFCVVSALPQSTKAPYGNMPGPPETEVSGESQGNSIQAMGDYAELLRSDPNNVAARLGIGLLKGQTGDFAGAAAEFQRAIAIDPASAQAHYDLGVAMVAGSKGAPDWVGAVKEFKTAVSLKPDYLPAIRMLGSGLIETGQPIDAIPVLTSALKMDPKSAEAHFELGKALEGIGENNKAYAEYLNAVALKRDYPEAQVALGNLCLEKEQFAAAEGRFKAALLSNPDLEQAHYGLARALRAQNEVAASDSEFRAAKTLIQLGLDAVRSSRLSNQALDQAKRGDFKAAIDNARQAVILEPDNAAAIYNLSLLLADSGQIAAAIQELRKAISLEPLQGRFYVNLSRMQEEIKDRPGAIESLRRALLLDPSNMDAEERLKALEASGTAAPQIAVGQRNSGTPFPYGAVANTAKGHLAFGKDLTKAGDMEGAVGEFLRASTLQPTNSEIRHQLALAYVRLGEDGPAELELREMLLLAPGSVSGRLELGKLLLRRGENKEASAEFRSVLAVQPGNRDAKELLKRSGVRQNHSQDAE